MHTPRIVPWANPAELTALCASFYPLDAHSPAELRRAVATVAAYEIRGRVPPAVGATAGLAAAVLADVDSETDAAGAVRVQLAYSMALVRFVNGLLDPAQQSQHALSLSVLARNMRLPLVFVNVRHAATHRALPPNPVLRALAMRALDWLWHNFWSLISASVDSAANSTKPPEPNRRYVLSTRPMSIPPIRPPSSHHKRRSLQQMAQDIKHFKTRLRKVPGKQLYRWRKSSRAWTTTPLGICQS
ncbi:Protein LAS1 [Neolecta irregularis DAH-3]|uniref:Protein LAS1 n=1 Tax=Neolecta irregularis (strain DAH-3) TaxID=1198029 RepID=A0A1U7LKA3_NEOID|nr:Protein LAS1 [Neolecta irregularis DAH-3]|eukprot:OLL22951.1 Protein LAS1 [Neolecta irregularis DAH-3]